MASFDKPERNQEGSVAKVAYHTLQEEVSEVSKEAHDEFRKVRETNLACGLLYPPPKPNDQPSLLEGLSQVL